MSSPLSWLRRALRTTASSQVWVGRLALLIIVACAAGLFIPSFGLPFEVQLLLAGVMAVAFVAVALGPVLFYDLVRTARRSRYYLIRVLYAAFLLLMVSWVYLAWTASHPTGGGTVSANEASAFASSVFYMFMGVQFVILTAVTPAYTAGAIAEEKERRTLEFLLATDLLNREIVLSKLLARLLNLLLLLLTGLPVLAGLQFLGGVDPALVFAGFTATGLTVASLAGLSIYNSTVTRRARDAIIYTYLMAFAYLALSGLSWLMIVPTGWADFPSTPSWTSPVTVRDLVEWFNAGNIIAVLVQMGMKTAATVSGAALDDLALQYLPGYAVFHGVVAVGGPLWSVLRLRAVALKETSEPVRRPKTRRVRGPWRPAVGKFPVLWKELFAEGGVRIHAAVRFIIALLILVSFVPTGVVLANELPGDLVALVLVVAGVLFVPVLVLLIEFVRGGKRGLVLPLILSGFLLLVVFSLRMLDIGFSASNQAWDDVAEGVQIWQVRVSGTAVASLLLLAVAMRAASTVGVERDRQTFDGLLTTPLDSDEILFGKWLGAVLSVRRGWIWLGTIWGLGLVSGGLHPLSVVLMLLAWFVYAAFLAGLGLWFSITSATTLRATTWTLICTVVGAFGHWLVWMCCLPFLWGLPGAPPRIFQWIAMFQVGLTPPLALGAWLPFSGEDLSVPHYWSDNDTWARVGFAVLGLVIWAVLAAVLWVISSARFRQLTGRLAIPRRRPPRPAREQEPARPAVATDGEPVAEALPADGREGPAPVEPIDESGPPSG